MKAELVQVIQTSDHVKRFVFKALETNSLDFVPGQFVIVTIPGLPEFSNTRSYSIASAPDGSAVFELCISINPNGKGTPVLWDLPEGSVLEMTEPQGSFVLNDPGDKDIAFICTGTGVAPFRSMIMYLLSNQMGSGNVYLIFGNRHEKDILYRNEFEELARENSRFKFIPVLSREPDWDGRKGYVHPVYQEIFADRRDAWFYVCGWKEMCRETRQHLKEMGYTRKQYFFEMYD